MATAEARSEERPEDLRPLLSSIAYRMTGGVGDAEDIVQEAYLRYQRALGEGTEVESPRAYLSAVVTRLSIDHLRSARVQREQYVGQWLPEPIVVDDAAGVEEQAEMADSLSLAFLVLLESLSPVERAVFLLREVFEYPYDEIASIVGRSEENCRQIALRARKHVDARRPRFQATPQEREELAGRFLAALGEGNMDELVQLLADDAATYADGGGKAPALTQSVQGNVRVARFLLGLQRYAERMRFMVRPAWVNGELGFVAFDAEGRVVSATALEIREGRIQAIRSIANPDKLRHIGSGKRAP